MTNDEIRRNDEIRMTKPATAQLRVFDIWASDFFRHSSFVIQRFVQVRFMVPMHSEKRKEALHEPSLGIESLPWESGAEDARTPNADASSTDLAGAKRVECVRFIGAFRPARDGQRFMATMHDFGTVEAFHESP